MKLSGRALIIMVLVLVGGGVMIYLATNVVPRTLTTLTKAAPAVTVSFEKSIVIGKRILAKADGTDKCVVNVFLAGESGIGVPGKAVELVETDNKSELKIETKSNVSDSLGNVSFEMTTTTEGSFKVQAMIEGVPVGRVVTVTFRN